MSVKDAFLRARLRRLSTEDILTQLLAYGPAEFKAATCARSVLCERTHSECHVPLLAAVAAVASNAQSREYACSSLGTYLVEERAAQVTDQVVSALLAALSDPQPIVVAAACNSLGVGCLWSLRGDKLAKVVTALQSMLDHSSPAVITEACEAMGKCSERVALAALVPSLLHPARETRLAVAEAFRELGQDNWAELVRGDEGDFARVLHSKHAGASKLLWRNMERWAAPHGDVRVAIVEALGGVSDKTALRWLLTQLGAPVAEVRAAAAKALERCGQGEWLDLVRGDADDYIRLLQSGHRDVAEVLGGPPEAEESLLAQLRDESGVVRQQAAARLSRRGAEHWSTLVRGDDGDFSRLLASGDLRVLGPWLADLEALVCTNLVSRAEVISACAAVDDERVGAWLIGQLTCPIGETRRAAADALAARGHDRLRDLVCGDDGDYLRLLRSPEWGLIEPQLADPEAFFSGVPVSRAEAIAACTAASGRGVDEWLVRQLLVQSEPDARLRAAEALAYRGQPQWRDLVRGDRLDAVRLLGSAEPAVIDVLLARLDDIELSCGNDALLAYALASVDDARAEAWLVAKLIADSSALRLAAAAALRDHGQPQWTERVHGDSGDLGRLAATGDSRLLDGIRAAAGSATGAFGEMAVRALAAFPPDVDLDERVALLTARFGLGINAVERAAAETLGRIGVAAAVSFLVGGLAASRRATRAAAVAGLVECAQHHPQVLAACWEDARQRIQTPHTDRTESEHNDWHHDFVVEHRDHEPPSMGYDDAHGHTDFGGHTDERRDETLRRRHADAGIGLAFPPPPTVPSATVSVHCPNRACRNSAQLPRHAVGRTATCAVCGTRFSVVADTEGPD